MEDFTSFVGILNGNPEDGDHPALEDVHTLGSAERDLPGAVAQVMPEGMQRFIIAKGVKGDWKRLGQAAACAVLINKIEHESFAWIFKQVKQPAGKLTHASPEGCQRFAAGA